MKKGVARVRVNPEEVAERVRKWREFYSRFIAPMNEERKAYR